MQTNRFLPFVLLALATTGLFAQAATEPVTAPVTTSHHQAVKVAKKGGKKGAHKKHKKHKKKAAK